MHIKTNYTVNKHVAQRNTTEKQDIASEQYAPKKVNAAPKTINHIYSFLSLSQNRNTTCSKQDGLSYNN